MPKPSEEILEIFRGLEDGDLTADRFPSADHGAIIQAIIYKMDLDYERRGNKNSEAERSGEI